jgi:hypothetical protein
MTVLAKAQNKAPCTSAFVSFLDTRNTFGKKAPGFRFSALCTALLPLGLLNLLSAPHPQMYKHHEIT